MVTLHVLCEEEQEIKIPDINMQLVTCDYDYCVSLDLKDDSIPTERSFTRICMFKDIKFNEIKFFAYLFLQNFNTDHFHLVHLVFIIENK